MILQSEEELDDSNFDWTCPNTRLLFPDPAFPRNLREPIRSAVDKSCPRPAPYRYVYIQVSADYMAAFIFFHVLTSFSSCSSQGAWYGPSSSQGSRLHGKQPWTSGAAEEDGSQSHPPERWQGAAGPARYTGEQFYNKDKNKKHTIQGWNNSEINSFFNGTPKQFF